MKNSSSLSIFKNKIRKWIPENVHAQSAHNALRTALDSLILVETPRTIIEQKYDLSGMAMHCLICSWNKKKLKNSMLGRPEDVRTFTGLYSNFRIRFLVIIDFSQAFARLTLFLTWNLNCYRNSVEWNPFTSKKKDFMTLYMQTIWYDSSSFIHNFNPNTVIWLQWDCIFVYRAITRHQC